MTNIPIIFLANKKDETCPDSIMEIIDYVPCGHEGCTAAAYEKHQKAMRNIKMGYELVNLKKAPDYLCVSFLSLPIEILDETEDNKYLTVSIEDVKKAIEVKKKEKLHVKFVRNQTDCVEPKASSST